MVRILFSDVNATTDDEGHYAIHRPTLLAEDVLLSAAALGYQPRTQQVQVSGHRSTHMDFRLERDAYQVAHTEVLNERGSLSCQLHAPGTGLGQQACDPPNVGLNGIEDPPTTWVWAIDTSIGLAGAVLQLHWEPETPFTQELHAVLRGPVVGCCEGESDNAGSKGEVHADVTGTSPLRLELPEETAQAFPHWSALWLEVSLPEETGDFPVSVSREQPFDAYATLFYVAPAPPGYLLA